MMKSPLPDAPAPQSLLEAAVYVDDLDPAREFYRDILGLKLFQEVPGRHMFFALGPSVLLVFNPTATSQPPGNPSARQSGWLGQRKQESQDIARASTLLRRAHRLRPHRSTVARNRERTAPARAPYHV